MDAPSGQPASRTYVAVDGRWRWTVEMVDRVLVRDRVVVVDAERHR